MGFTLTEWDGAVAPVGCYLSVNNESKWVFGYCSCIQAEKFPCVAAGDAILFQQNLNIFCHNYNNRKVIITFQHEIFVGLVSLRFFTFTWSNSSSINHQHEIPVIINSNLDPLMSQVLPAVGQVLVSRARWWWWWWCLVKIILYSIEQLDRKWEIMMQSSDPLPQSQHPPHIPGML